MRFARRAFTITWKDLLTERRTKEQVNSLAYFAVLLLFLFQFAIGPDQAKIREAAPGLLWLSFILTGILGLGRAFQVERENECLEGLLLSPVDREAIFLGKLLGNTIMMLLLSFFLLPLFAVFYNLDLWRSLPSILVVVFLGIFGFAVVGTLYSAMTANVRARELLFPLLLLPLVVPVLLASVTATKILMEGGSLSKAMRGLQLLVGFDIIFLVVALLAFEFVVEE